MICTPYLFSYICWFKVIALFTFVFLLKINITRNVHLIKIIILWYYYNYVPVVETMQEKSMTHRFEAVVDILQRNCEHIISLSSFFFQEEIFYTKIYSYMQKSDVWLKVLFIFFFSNIRQKILITLSKQLKWAIKTCNYRYAHWMSQLLKKEILYLS